MNISLGQDLSGASCCSTGRAEIDYQQKGDDTLFSTSSLSLIPLDGNSANAASPDLLLSYLRLEAAIFARYHQQFVIQLKKNRHYFFF